MKTFSADLCVLNFLTMHPQTRSMTHILLLCVHRLHAMSKAYLHFKIMLSRFLAGAFKLVGPRILLTIIESYLYD